MRHRRTALEIKAEKIAELNRKREIFHLKGELARELGIDMSGFFGMYPNNYQFALLSNLGGRELALMQIILRMTYESMCTEWYFTGAQLKEFAKNFTPIVNGRHIIPVGNDKDMGILGVGRELARRGFFIWEKVEHTNGNKTMHRVQITANTITLKEIADMKQINDGYHFLLGEANYHGLFDEEYSEIGIINYNYLNKSVKEHKKRGTKLPDMKKFNSLNTSKEEVNYLKSTYVKKFKEPICDESVPSDRHNTNKTNNTDAEEELDSSYEYKTFGNGYEAHIQDETKSKEKPTKENFRLQANVLIDSLKLKVGHKSKVKATPELYEAYDLIQDKTHIEANYIKHQELSGKYAKTLENFLTDYETIVKDMQQSNTKKKPSAIDRAV